MSPIVVSPDAPLFIVMNAGSGSEEANATRATMEYVLSRSGRKYEIEMVRDGATLGEVARQVVARARAAKGVVVAAGGDGTINAVTTNVLGSGCALGVIPLGTFNYFCRNHEIPLDVREATEAVLSGRAHPVQIGLVNERVFLVNASLGLYPQILEDREGYKQRYGRNRLVALWSGLVTLARDFRQLRIHVEQDGERSSLRTPTVFVGNNRLQLEQIGMGPEVIRDGHLTAIMLKPVGGLALFWLMIRGAFRTLGEAENVTSYAFREMTVTFAGRQRTGKAKVATDGEIAWMDSPLVFRTTPEPLYLIKPDPVSS